MRRLAFCTALSLAILIGLIMDKAHASPKQHAQLSGTSASAATRTAVGPAIALAHGMVQVQVVCVGTRIIDVKALQLPHDNQHSWLDSLNAAAVLRSEVLSKQTTDLHVVSGATYTSAAYLQSLQAALDVAAPIPGKMSATPMG